MIFHIMDITCVEFLSYGKSVVKLNNTIYIDLSGLLEA